MASKATIVFVALVVILCLTLMSVPPSGCGVTKFYGCFVGDKAGFLEGYNRKVGNGVRELMKYKVGSEKRELNTWELRRVPSGPDPLHHNVKGPKKPRSP